MAYKDILVLLDILPDAQQRLDVAVTLAVQHQARLIGLNVASESARVGDWRDRVEAIERQFEMQAAHAGVAKRYHDPDSAHEALMRHLHQADLIIAPQVEADLAGLVRPNLAEDALLRSGVPVLVVPPLWRPAPERFGERVVVAWNASREATRAVHDAMPLLRRATEVTVFTVASDIDAARGAIAPLLDHLQAHGVKAEANPWQQEYDLSVVEALFACLSARQADLIVAGAYGHSRRLEGFLGGPSEDLVHEPTVPILMTH